MELIKPFRLVAIVAIFLCVTACAITPPHVQNHAMCDFASYALDVEDAPTGPIGAGSGGPTSVHELLRSLGTGLAAGTGPTAAVSIGGSDRRARSDAILILSGGSEHGAFGAGFLDAWHQNARDHQLPAFKMVTGVSTGAILATFAFVDRPQDAVAGYSILHEAELLELYVKAKNGSPTSFSYLNILRKGAIGDLGPLRQRLHRFIPQAMLEEVYRQSGLDTPETTDDRSLLVGVVDVDTGRARALDLTKMAARHHQALATQDTKEAARRWDCYIEAVVASSSAPLAARPVFIDNRMYVDGGARFGLFYAELRNEMASEAERTKARANAPKQHIFVIINGDQQLPPLCGKLDENNCPDGETPKLNGFHKKWNFLALAIRSEKILGNQVYRFSADSIRNEADNGGLIFHSALIESDDILKHDWENADGALQPTGTKTCAEWRAKDREIDNPIQFEPRYMRCLISYGRDRETNFYKWHSLTPQ